MVDVSLCSHIIMGFATVGRDYSVDLNPIGGYEALASFAELRKRRPSLKLMITVGGGAGDSNFKEMASTESNRQRFINSTAWALRRADLDGIDLDWEYPEVADAANFVSLLQEASAELKRDPQRPLLSAAVPAPVTLVVGRYRIPAIAKSVDFVNLMTYDLHTYQWYTPFVDHNSPLFPRAGELPVLNKLNLATWILSNGYGGTMTFSLDSDDWQGKCGNGTFPLHKAIAHQGNDGNSQHLQFNR
ncbi:hypothetical protein HPB52_012617 [Rhipicephalus sanguineus]|uniref:GH18 domain-containing protein n=1 Tax=Rhipicephalus sanguineus TaxID=34632 RepID=A0A9D4Q2A9_RHISA|nr:hypothetical protein HPB52_012617 [Rhipicephalus sanguineus]